VDSNPVGAVFSDITRSSGIIANGGMNSINSRDWTTGATFDPNDYYEFTITPNAGYELDANEIFITFRSSATGPDVFQLRHSLNASQHPYSRLPLAGIAPTTSDSAQALVQ
jgi:hypothetical protein